MKPSAKKRSQLGQTNNTAKLLAPLLALYQSGQQAQAQKQAEELVAHYPALGLAWKILGSLYQQQGLFSEAAHAFEQAANTLSKDAEVCYNWGNICFQQQSLTQAQALYEKAIAIQPKFSQAHANLACVFKAQGQTKRAEKSFSQALNLQPKDVFVLSNLALLLHEAGKPKEAMQYYRRAYALTPNDEVLLFNMAQAFEDVEDFAQAEKFYNQAIALNPNYEDALFNLALYLKKNERYEESKSLFQALLKLNPDYENGLENLLNVYQSQGGMTDSLEFLKEQADINPSANSLNNIAAHLIRMGLFIEAEKYCLSAIALDDSNSNIYCNLGLIHQAKREHQQACMSFEKALSLNPTSAITLSNYAVTLRVIGELSKAEHCLEKAVAIDPIFANAYLNLSNIYLDKGDIEKSIETLTKILSFEPEYLQAMQNILLNDAYINCLGAEAHLDLAIRFGQLVSKNITRFTAWKHHPLDSRLRVGLLSGDFRNHPVCFFILNWLRNNNAKNIEVYAYATDAREDEYTGEVKGLCSQWRCLAGKTDKQAAELMHDDGLHILIDLSGHTAGGRLPIMAFKPAPIQAEWLGYWSTTGLAAIDYFIADSTSLPKHFESHFSEKIAYLPHTRLCYSPLETAPDVNQLPALNNHFITFGCFQNYTKVNAEVLALWAKVLKKLPDAQMRWHCKAFNDDEIKAHALKRFAAKGIRPERIYLEGELDKLAYLQAHHQVDFILDSFPFTGGTTTCDALWMGVPTLTLLGETVIGCQGASLIHSAGLSDWVVNSKDDYVAKAVYWANHLDDLATIRQQLRQQVLNSPLMNAAQFAQDFEKLMFSLWREYLTQASPHAYLAHQPIQALYEGNQPVWVVSATRMDETSFWQHSALGRSLRRQMQQDQRLFPRIAFNNTRGLSELFNEAIEAAPDHAILVFIHDDVWLDQNTFTHQLLQGLSQYDVIGLAGNKRLLPAQPSWLFVNTDYEWDSEEFVAGTVSHGQDAFGDPTHFGATPSTCELIDGVFLATSKKSLVKYKVRFDTQFKFHFYDLDFCRTARDAGLQLGVWPVAITHQSPGDFNSVSWKETYLQYLNKWQETAFFQDTAQFMETTIDATTGDLNVDESTTAVVNTVIEDESKALQHAVDDVYQFALACQQAGDSVQAECLYQEILQVFPQHPEANHNLGFIQAYTKSIEDALPRFELAVMGKPECEQYWVSYIEAFMIQGQFTSAITAIDLGQQYGLSASWASILLGDCLRSASRRFSHFSTDEDVANAVTKLQISLFGDEESVDVKSLPSLAELEPRLIDVDKPTMVSQTVQWHPSKKTDTNLPVFPESWLKAYPQSLMIEYTSRCNLRCKYCSKSNPGDDEIPGRNMDMTAETVDSVIRLIEESHYNELLLAGTGESTFHPHWREDFPRLIHAGKKSNPACYVHVNSNFAAKYEDEDWMVFAQLDGIVISIDTADRQLTREVRAKSDLGLIIYNITRLQTYCQLHGLPLPILTVNVTLYHEAAAGLPELMVLLSNLPIKQVSISDLFEREATDKHSIRPLHNDDLQSFTQAVKSLKLAMEIADKQQKFTVIIQPHLLERIEAMASQDLQINDAINKPKKVSKSVTKLCLQPWTRFTLAADGSIFPCCMTEMDPVGHILSAEEQDGLNGQGIRAFRHALLRGDMPTACRHCTNAPDAPPEMLQAAVSELTSKDNHA